MKSKLKLKKIKKSIFLLSLIFTVLTNVSYFALAQPEKNEGEYNIRQEIIYQFIHNENWIHPNGFINSSEKNYFIFGVCQTKQERMEGKAFPPYNLRLWVDGEEIKLNRIKWRDKDGIKMCGSVTWLIFYHIVEPETYESNTCHSFKVYFSYYDLHPRRLQEFVYDDLSFYVDWSLFEYHESEKYSYFHYLPTSALERSKIRTLLYTHGSPKVDNYSAMEDYIRYNELPRIKPYCDKYGYALVIMVTPRLWGDYPDYKMNTQSMNRWVMFDNDFDKDYYDFYKRPDLEFIRVIEDFKLFLRNRSLTPEEKVYIGGFSNGGMQANRFSILHPDRIAATAIGGAGAYIYPMESLNGNDLTYPVGISDVDQISDTHYNLSLFKTIPHLIFVGENDTKIINDPVPHGDHFSEEHSDLINTYFGKDQVERAINYSNYLNSIGMDCQFDLYEGIGHEYTPEMVERMFEFFEQN